MKDKVKISHSGDIVLELVGFLLICFIIIQLLLALIFNELELAPATIIFLLSLLLILKQISGTVSMNQCIVLLSDFSKKRRAVFEGFYFKLPWETIEYSINLEATINATVTQSYPTTDGTVEVTAEVVFNPDSAEGEDEVTRSYKMIEYVQYKDDTVIKLIKARISERMRSVFKNISVEKSLSLDRDQILNATHFSDIAELASIQIKICIISRLSRSEAIQNARDSISKAEAMLEVITTMKSYGIDSKDAIEMAQILNKDIPVTKKIEEIRFSGINIPDSILQIIKSFADKLGKN